MHIILSHGRESNPNSAKLIAMAQAAEALGHSTYRVDDSDTQDPDLRAERLSQRIKDDRRELILVGSSMGGYTSVVAGNNQPQVKGLFLICPALHLPRYQVQDYPTTAQAITVLHGWRDDVVLYEHSLRFAREHKANLHLIDADHRMQENIPEIVQHFRLFLTHFSAK